MTVIRLVELCELRVFYPEKLHSDLCSGKVVDKLGSEIEKKIVEVTAQVQKCQASALNFALYNIA
jgi:hypothetical protein